jgi:hypothetical protein
VLGVLAAVLLVGVVIERGVLEWAISQAEGPADDAAVASEGPIPPLLEPEEIAALIEERLRAGSTASPRPLMTSSGELLVGVEPAGEVMLPSGRVVVSDAFFVGLSQPLARSIAAGQAPITLLLASSGVGDSTPAAALLGPTAGLSELHWQPAFAVGEDPAAYGPDEVPAYPVDSGTAAFTSAEAATSHAAEAAYTDLMLDALERSGYLRPAELRFEDGLSVVAFPSGFGDGAYPVWLGLGPSGRAVAVLTDFAILDHPLADTRSPAPEAP